MKTFVLSLSVLFAALSLPAVAADEQRQAEVAKLGADVMPFNLKATTHVFTKTAEGGTQRVIAKNAADTTQVRLVREHLHDIQAQFLKGDFSGPSHIHGNEMPGLADSRLPSPVRLRSITRTCTAAQNCPTELPMLSSSRRFTNGSTLSFPTTALTRWLATRTTCTRRRSSSSESGNSRGYVALVKQADTSTRPHEPARRPTHRRTICDRSRQSVLVWSLRAWWRYPFPAEVSDRALIYPLRKFLCALPTLAVAVDQVRPLYARQPERDALICHSDRGSQHVSIRYTERLAEAGIEPSVGSKGDSYDTALAETINGLYKAELIHRRAPWKTKEAVELATLEWVSWFNHHRLLEPIGYIPPAEAEANYYRQLAESAVPV